MLTAAVAVESDEHAPQFGVPTGAEIALQRVGTDHRCLLVTNVGHSHLAAGRSRLKTQSNVLQWDAVNMNGRRKAAQRTRFYGPKPG